MYTLSDNTQTLAEVDKRKPNLVLLDVGSASITTRTYDLADIISKTHPELVLVGQTAWNSLCCVKEARSHFDAIVSKSDEGELVNKVAGLYEDHLAVQRA